MFLLTYLQIAYNSSLVSCSTDAVRHSRHLRLHQTMTSAVFSYEHTRRSQPLYLDLEFTCIVINTKAESTSEIDLNVTPEQGDKFRTNSVYWCTDSVTTCRSATKRSGLRSSLTTDYVKPRLSTKFGERHFLLPVWSQLPHQLCAILNPAAFKKHLKNALFKFCF